MLLGSFYKILNAEKADQLISATVEFNEGHDIFKGHFPQNPIVPGVCQIQMLDEVLNSVLGTTWQLKNIAQAKFLSFINPTVNKTVSLELKIEKEETGQLLLSASYFSPQQVFFKFKGEFQ